MTTAPAPQSAPSQTAPLTAEAIERLFTRPDGSWLCARWGRPISPIVFGTDDATLATIKGAIEAVARFAGHSLAETDPELGANLMLFFFRDWSELTEVPNLEGLIPDLPGLCQRLSAQAANQYRSFRCDENGAIRAVIVFLRMDAHLAPMPAADLALIQAARIMLTWSETAFSHFAPLAVTPEGKMVLNPEMAALIRAAYDPLMPASMRDPAHALRLMARIGLQGGPHQA